MAPKTVLAVPKVTVKIGRDTRALGEEESNISEIECSKQNSLFDLLHFSFFIFLSSFFLFSFKFNFTLMISSLRRVVTFSRHFQCYPRVYYFPRHEQGHNFQSNHSIDDKEKFHHNIYEALK